MKNTENINCNFCSIPFKTSLSFEYLIDELKAVSTNNTNPMQKLATEVLDDLEKTPELKGKINDYSILSKHKTLLDQLMSFVINPINNDIEISAAYPPFDFNPFFSTQLFDDTIKGEHRKLEIAKDIENDKFLIMMIYNAYLIILDKIYDYNIDIDIPFSMRLTDEQDNSVKFFKKQVNAKYIRVKSIGRIKKITHEEIKELFDNSNDLNLWNEKIPLEKFEFSGFLAFNYVNITHDFVISQLKSDLLDKNTIPTKEGFNRIQRKIRALVENPDMEFGMAAYHDFESNLNQNLVWNTIIPSTELKCTDYIGTIYEKAFVERRIVLTDDFEKLEKDKLVEAFLAKGIRSHAIVPLIIEDEIVGMLEFGCAIPGNLNMIQIKRLHELFPIFAIALRRSMEEWVDKVRAIIQEEFTAIHPTVEWRFRQAVAKLLNENRNGESSIIDPIVFQDVIPIYGASDIRGSSIERNIAIQADLTEQMEHAKSIIKSGKRKKEMPLLNDLSYKIDKHLETVKSGLKAGDEVIILEFLKREVDPVLALLKDRFEEMAEPVDEYFKLLDEELGVLYKKRKNFEESLTLINEKVSEIIDTEQLKAQSVFPHYFERYRTDGIEYNGYIGQSMVKDLKYSDIYLKNIRLWQLLVKVKIARKIRKIQPSLKTKLDITQLILVHSNPLSIAFRQDEKKFDVAGAYNIRYEITKKRIDKAAIKGTNERITQIGKIAIIYSHAAEIGEYKKYIDYMIAQGFLTDSVEEFELEDLKGASGLRALRVDINFKDLTPNEIDPAEIEEVVNQN